MRNYVRSLALRLQANYWFFPLVLAFGALGLSFVTLALDRLAIQQGIGGMPGAATSIDTVRTLLSTIAASTITTVGIVYSLTMVALVLGSQQYGPLVVYNFLRDRTNQVTMGVFVGTFLYCIRILSAVDENDGIVFSAGFSTFVALVLAVLSVIVLIYFINHVAMSIRANNVIDSVARYLADPTTYFAIPAGYDPASPTIALPDEYTDPPRPIYAQTTGYIQFMDEGMLLDLAIAHDAIIDIRMRPGMYVIAHGIVGRVKFRPLPAGGDAEARAAAYEAIRDGINAAVYVGNFRTQEQDIELIFNQLVTIAIRALSPAVNDPYTAIMCLNRIADGLSRVANEEIPSPRRCDAGGMPRLILNPVRFDQLIHLSLDQIFHYGKADLNIVLHILRIMHLIGEALTGDRQAELLAYVNEVYARSLTMHTTPYAQQMIETEYRAAVAALND